VQNLIKGVDHTGISLVFFCHDGKGNFLLNKRSDNCRDECGTWDPGGGGLELGEPVEDGLRKEIKEEYCTDILASEFLGFRDVHREVDGVKTHWVALDFKVLVDRSMVKNGEPHKSDGVAWFTFDELPSPLHSQFPYFLEKYADKLGATAASGTPDMDLLRQYFERIYKEAVALRKELNGQPLDVRRKASTIANLSNLGIFQLRD